jgi:hypothetical protein
MAGSDTGRRLSQAGTRYSATVMLATTRRWVVPSDRTAAVPMRSVRMLSSTSSLQCTTANPAAVSRARPPFRSSRSSPRDRSKERSRMLAAGWLMLCASAAWRIEPCSATLRKRSSERMSGTGSASGIRIPYRVAP